MADKNFNLKIKQGLSEQGSLIGQSTLLSQNASRTELSEGFLSPQKNNEPSLVNNAFLGDVETFTNFTRGAQVGTGILTSALQVQRNITETTTGFGQAQAILSGVGTGVSITAGILTIGGSLGPVGLGVAFAVTTTINFASGLLGTADQIEVANRSARFNASINGAKVNKR